MGCKMPWWAGSETPPPDKDKMIADLRAEVASLKASQCTSPWEDSPPCRGIQRQLDIVADLTQQLAAANGRVKKLEVKARAVVDQQLAIGNSLNSPLWSELLSALSDLPEADKEKS